MMSHIHMLNPVWVHKVNGFVLIGFLLHGSRLVSLLVLLLQLVPQSLRPHENTNRTH